MSNYPVRWALDRADWEPALSLVFPCYNEEDCLGETAPALVAAFQAEGIDFELVMVDNGSTDRTGAIIDELIERGLPVTKVAIPINRGYGHGIVTGLRHCRGHQIGYLCADGQVAPEDVVRTYRLGFRREERVLTKVRRRFRQDSWRRKLVSITYNGLMQVVFGWLGAIDINGSPKIFSRRAFEAMQLQSDDWFLDPEIILKARGLGLRIIEIDVEGYARYGGVSNVKPQTIGEFLRNIWRYRAGPTLRNWAKSASSFREERRRDHLPERSTAPSDNTPLIERIRVIAQPRHVDHRGFVQKILRAGQAGGRMPAGEVYVTSAVPGDSKGHHYHLRMGEWFSAIQGTGRLVVVDPRTLARREIELSVERPSAVYVPAGLAHAVINDGDETLLCVACADREHDPTDVYPMRLDLQPAATPSAS